MTDMSADLVTKIDVLPDLAGLNSFDAAIDKAIAKVNQLDAAIKRVNNLKPSSPYAPSGASAMPSATTTAAVAAITATGVNLISRTPLADTVRKEAQKVARAAVQGAGGGVAGLLSPPGGGGLGLPPPPQGGWFAGRAGGLMDPRAGNPLSKYDTSAKSFSNMPLTPAAEAIKTATGGGFRFGMDNLLAGAGLTAGVVAGANAMADSMDTIQRQQAQLARLAQTTGDAKEAFFALNAAASDMRSDSGSFISTYTNMATATEKLGYSQERTIKATQGLVGALQLGGGSEEAKSAALYQMGQAFSSDRFGGDEFRSFMEAIGTMAPKVAEAFGTDVKGLRQMSEQGKLTADAMFKAFEKMAANNADLLKKQGWTWGQVTTVMANDWQAFLAKATIGGEWQRFTDWAANTLIPVARSAEKEVAEFWSTLSDDSKSTILIGILGAVGAAFAALAVPIIAAIWPFLAVGAAVWFLREVFIEWKHWMNGEGGSIFDELFGSFDEFEKRYPKIVEMLRGLREVSGVAEQKVYEIAGIKTEDTKLNSITKFMLDLGGSITGLFGGGGNLMNPAIVPPSAKNNAQTTITNSGNTSTVIQVASPKEAAETANNLTNPGTMNSELGGNMHEVTGAR